MANSRLQSVFKYVGLSLAGLLGLVVVVLGAGILVARSHWGEQKILGIVLPIINKSLTGRVEVGGIGGTLLSGLVLRDIKLYDSENELAASVGSAEVGYHLASIVHKNLNITFGEVKDAHVRARFLRDGRLNFAALTRPSPPGGPLPITITASNITVDLGAIFEPQPGTQVPPADVQLHLEASAKIADPRFGFEVKTLKIITQKPLGAEIELHGAASLLNVEKPEVQARDLSLTVRTQGKEVNRLIHAAVLQGDWQLALRIAGSLDKLAVEGTLTPPKGTLSFKANAGVALPKLPWQLQLSAQGIDPAAAVVIKDVPGAKVDLEVSGHGEGPSGRVDLQKLAVTLSDPKARASLSAHGFFEGNATTPITFPVPPGIAAQLSLNVDAPDLHALAAPYAPGLHLAGALRAKVDAAADHGQLRLDVDTHGQHLHAAGQSVEELALALHSQDLAGKVVLHAKSLHTPLDLERLDLDALLNPKTFSLHAAGTVGPKLMFELSADGQPQMRAKQLLKLDVALQKLMVAHNNDRIDLDAPAHIALDMQPANGPIIDLDRLAMRMDDQRIAVGGHFEAQTQRFRGAVSAQAINAKRWAQIFNIAQVPKTAFNLQASASGTPKAIEGQLKLDGSAEAIPNFHVPRSDLHVAVKLHNERAEGELGLQLGDVNKGGDRPRLDLRFAAPISLYGPIMLDLNARVLTQEIVELLPADIRDLRGLVTLHTAVQGTLQQPQLALSVKVPWFQNAEVRGKDAALDVTYAQDQLKLHLDAKLASDKDAPLGGVTASAQTRVHVAVGPQMDLNDIKKQLLQNPMGVDAVISSIDIPKIIDIFVPAQTGMLQSGIVDAKLHVQGAPMTPQMTLNVDAKQLAAQGLKDAAVAATLAYSGNNVRVDVNAGLPNQPLIKAHGETTVAVAQILAAGFDPKALAIRAALDVLPFELSQVSPIHGSLKARADVQGTVGVPVVKAWVRSDSLQIDNFTVGPLAVDISLDEKQMLKANVDLKQKDGGLKLIANTPIPLRPDSLQATFTANNFQIDYSPPPGATKLIDALGMARGVLNADLKVTTAEYMPSVRGYLKLEKGGVMLKALPQPFDNIYVDLQIEPDGKKSNITLRQAQLVADNGRVKLTGSAQLDALQLKNVSLDAEARNFPIWAGVFGLWIDAKVKVRGQVQNDTLKIDVNVADGSVRVPKIESAHAVQELGPFEDVHFVDRQAVVAAKKVQADKKKAEEKAQAAKDKKPSGFMPLHIEVAARLPDDFRVSGPELRANLTGRVDLAIGPDGIPHITGDIRTSPGWGWVEIFRKRYEIDQVQLSLSGEVPPNPLFNIQIERKIEDGTIYVMVNGTARKPQITFRSDPPTYDQSQIIAMILTGDDGGSGKDPQAMGMLSSLLIGQLRDQLSGRLPIDVLRVDVGGNDAMGLNSSSLEIGKYLRDDLYLGYKRRFGQVTTGTRALNADEALLEYHFFRSYKLRTLYGDANVGAIDLYWTKRF